MQNINMARICLINPPIRILARDVLPTVPPMGLLCIAAMLRSKGHDVHIIDTIIEDDRTGSRADYGMGREAIIEKLVSFNPSWVGITNNITVNEADAVECASIAKAVLPGVKTVLGGSSVTVRAREVLAAEPVDYAIRGDGDLVLPELVRRVDSGIRTEGIRGVCWKSAGNIHVPDEIEHVEDLSVLPMPAWDLVPVEKYLSRRFPFVHVTGRNMVMHTSRGCVSNCVFCTGRDIQGRFRPRPIEAVKSEIDYLVKNHSVNSLHFMDSNINADRDRFVDLCAMLKQTGLPWNPLGGIYFPSLNPECVEIMLDSGCFYFTLSAEHGCERIQKFIGKKVPLDRARDIIGICKKRGVWSHASFVVGFPSETPAETMECLDYAKRAGVDSISVFTAVPLPGSRLHAMPGAGHGVSGDDFRLLGRKSFFDTASTGDLERIKNLIFRRFLLHKVLKTIFNPAGFIRRVIVSRGRYFRCFLNSAGRFRSLMKVRREY